MRLQPNRKNSMQDRTKFEIGLFIALVVGAIVSRFWLIDYPNFKPIAAAALFGGLLFRKVWIGMAAIAIAMMVSNLAIGGYEWQIALAVNLSLVLVVVLGAGIRKWIDVGATGTMATLQRGTILLAASLVTATTFFLLTNLATWYCWYPANVSGLVDCFTAALPFYRWTLAGDLTFVVVFAIAYEFALRWEYGFRWLDAPDGGAVAAESSVPGRSCQG